MLFQSQAFLLGFLPVVLTGWYAVARHVRLREWLLIAASLVFYGWWDPRFVVLLLAQTVVSWAAATIYLTTDRRPHGLILAAIAFNIAILTFFKYWTFVATNVVNTFGISLPAPHIILPIGISFFTFEIISYLADVRWHGAPRYSLRRYLLFVCLFPRLIAGPIVRHHEIIPQFDTDPRRDGLAERMSKGAIWIVIGLVKKVFIADPLAAISDPHFANAAAAPLDFGAAWSGALAFTLQLYFDFSAYSEIAIGVALMLGFVLPQNFDAPYRATNLRDFWRRWHMTLSRYIRDYVYVPLGGSRSGASRYVTATLVAMALCGLWHGAGWTFVTWGLFHGFGLIIFHFWDRRGLALPQAAAWMITLLFVICGWVLFRAADFAAASSMLISMSGLNGLSGHLDAPALLAVAALIALAGPTTASTIAHYLKPQPVIAVAAALAVCAVVLKVGGGQAQDFIYFQF